MFAISIDPEARALLKEQHGAAVTIRTTPRHGCCGGNVLVPVVEPRRPEERQGWEKFESDGVQIFFDPGLDVPEGAALRIGMDKLFLWHKFWIEGLETQLR